MAFSSRLTITCLMSMGSMGRYKISSDSSRAMGQSGNRRRMVSRASPATSSSISSCLFRGMTPSRILVMESRFSTMALRESASLLMSRTREALRSEEAISSLDSSTEAAPEMAVRGVRRSWDTARRILPRMVSRSAWS